MNPKNLSTTDFCDALFEPGEHTCFSNSTYGIDVFPVSQARKLTKPLAFFSINAIKPHTTRNDHNVASLRSFLIECDSGPLKAQSSYIKELELPYSTMVFSGSKSLHYIVSLEVPLPNKPLYDAYANRLHKVVKNCDHTTRNPSRFSRFPGHFREEKQLEQKLLNVKPRVSLADLEQWLIDHNVPWEEPRVTVAVDDVFEGMILSAPNNFTNRFIARGSERGMRNKDLYLAAHDLRACGFSYEAAVACLEESPVCSEWDFSRKEFERTILSAFQKNTL